MFIKAAAVSALLAGSAAAVPAELSLDTRQLGGTVTNGALANWNSNNINDGVGGGSDSYKMYWGTGTTGEGWPDRSRWVSFVDMSVYSKNREQKWLYSF